MIGAAVSIAEVRLSAIANPKPLVKGEEGSSHG